MNQGRIKSKLISDFMTEIHWRIFQGGIRGEKKNLRCPDTNYCAIGRLFLFSFPTPPPSREVVPLT